MAAATPARPADRYGAQRPGLTQRGWWRVVGVVVVLGVLLAALWAWTTRDQVTWRDVSYRVESPASTRVAFQVTMAPGTVAVCTVRALNAGFGEVGLLDVEVGPSDERTVGRTVVVPTSELAVTGTVKTCAVRGG